MEVLLQKIRALHATNEEIIARVEALTDVHHYAYHLTAKNPGLVDHLVLEEVLHPIQVSDILEEFAFDGELRSDVWDIFNDKPDWTCSTWADLKRLNKELLAISAKFELLDKGNVKLSEELAKYLHNFEIIQTGLGQVERRTLSEQSRLRRLHKHVAKINHLLAELKKEGVRFEAPERTLWRSPSIGSSVELRNEGKTVRHTDTGDISYQTVVLDRLISSGAHRFSFMLDHSSSSILIGVVAKSWSEWTQYLGRSGDSWGCGSAPHQVRSRAAARRSTGCGRSFRTGDVVQMTVDMDNKTISYSINGEHFGVYPNIISGEVYPAVTLLQPGDQITLQD